jgi:hypothetical protein
MCKHFTCQNKVNNRRSKHAKDEQWSRLCQRMDCCGCGRCLNPVDPGQYPIPDEGKLYLNSMATDLSMNMKIEECFDWLEGAGFTRADDTPIRPDMDEVLAATGRNYETEELFGLRYYTTVIKTKKFAYPPGCMVQIMSYHDPDVRMSEATAMRMPRRRRDLYAGESAHVALVFNFEKRSTVYDAFSECVKDPETGDEMGGFCNDPEFVMHTAAGLELDYDGGSYYFPAAELGSNAVKPRYVGPAEPEPYSAKAQRLLAAQDEGQVTTDTAGQTDAAAHNLNVINEESICDFFESLNGATTTLADITTHFNVKFNLAYAGHSVGNAVIAEVSGMAAIKVITMTVVQDAADTYANNECRKKAEEEDAAEDEDN